MIRIFQKLQDNLYGRLGSLFEGFDHTLIVRAVIEGYCPGEIYVDDTDCPHSGFIASQEGYYLAGDAQLDLFNAGLRDFFKKDWDDGISLNFHPDSWGPVVETILADKFPVIVHGYTYEFERMNIPDWISRIPAECRMVCVDEKLLARDDMKNSEAVREYITHVWASRTDFLERGFGFCLIHGDVIVSWCLSDCVSGTRCEIGIETDEEYRRRGFATLTASAAVAHCLEKGFTRIGWHTGPTNVASMRTAEKVGFKKVLEDTYYFSWFFPIDNFIEHGYISFIQGDYGASAGWYQKAVDIIESGAGFQSSQIPQNHSASSLYFYLACALARAGEDGKCLANLERFAQLHRDIAQARIWLEESRALERLRQMGRLRVVQEFLEKK